MSKTRRAVSQSRPFTKALFEAGQQCAKRLYLDFHHPDEVPPLPERRRRMAETGQKLVQMARTAFPKGHEISAENVRSAVTETHQLLHEGKHAVLFDAAFQHEDLLVRSDIVLRNPDGTIDLFEVKSGVKVKPRHVLDLAFQVHAIERTGVEVRATFIVHLNPKYQHDGGKDYPIHQLFKNADVTVRVRRRLEKVEDQLASYHELITSKSTLDISTGTWCTHPFRCPYLKSCTKEGPEHPLRELPGLTRDQESEFRREEIEDLTQIDSQRQGLTLRQRRTIQAINEQKLLVEPFIHQELSDVDYPLHFLVIQYHLEVLPRFSGAKPWHQLPYMWTTQVLHEDGKTEERSFLMAERTDPRGEFIRTLNEELREAGTVVYCSDSDPEQLRTLLEDLPDTKSSVRSVLHAPRIDLGRLIEAGVHHPDLRERNELCDVMDVLIENRTRPKLEISDPEQARTAFERILAPRTRATTRAKLGEQLLEFSRWQSSVLVEAYRHLMSQHEPA